METTEFHKTSEILLTSVYALMRLYYGVFDKEKYSKSFMETLFCTCISILLPSIHLPECLGVPLLMPLKTPPTCKAAVVEIRYSWWKLIVGFIELSWNEKGHISHWWPGQMWLFHSVLFMQGFVIQDVGGKKKNPTTNGFICHSSSRETFLSADGSFKSRA